MLSHDFARAPNTLLAINYFSPSVVLYTHIKLRKNNQLRRNEHCKPSALHTSRSLTQILWCSLNGYFKLQWPGLKLDILKNSTQYFWMQMRGLGSPTQCKWAEHGTSTGTTNGQHQVTTLVLPRDEEFTFCKKLAKLRFCTASGKWCTKPCMETPKLFFL